MKNEIHLLDVLRSLDEKTTPEGNAITHDIVFIQYSKRNKTNGHIKKVYNVVQCGLKFGRVDKSMRAVKSVSNNEIRQFYIRLLIEFDNKKVVW